MKKSIAIAAIVIVAILVLAGIIVALNPFSGKTKVGNAPAEITQNATDWPLANKDYNNSRSTSASTITSENVDTLGLSWSSPITASGTFGGASSVPIIYGDSVLFQEINGNLACLNFTTGAIKWTKEYNDDRIEGPNGPGIGYGKVFISESPWSVTALSLENGSVIWTKLISDIEGTGIDIQPVVYDGLVYTSTVPGTGDRFYGPGGIGTIYALDEKSGDIVWSFDTVPQDLWGHPEVNSGGGCWYPPAIDTKTGIMFWAIANPAPFPGAPGWPNGTSFAGSALYTDCMVALDHATGKMIWYSQAKAHDIFDHDLQISPILASAYIGGVDQDIVIGAGKMGNVYAFNRGDGHLLWQCPVGTHINDYLDRVPDNTTVQPGALGGVETCMAYSDGVVYVPVVELPMVWNSTSIVSLDFSKGKGQLVAIDVNLGRILWNKTYDSLNVGGATVVNDVVFTATLDGMIYGYQKDTGDQVFTYQAPGGINAWPAVKGDTIIWPCGIGPSAALIALKLGATVQGPLLSITSPADGSSVQGPNVMIMAKVLNFQLVDKLGQANVAGEGHLHYFLDVAPPTTPGQPAVTASGTYAATTATSYTWTNVSAGTHMFSVELVNNDHTPLEPAITASINVTVTEPSPSTNIFVQAQNVAFNVTSITVSAGSTVNIHFDNLDSGVPHNMAFYTDSSATTIIFQGQTITGVSSITYTFTAPTTPGTYFFRCDVHPTLMTGSFIVV